MAAVANDIEAVGAGTGIPPAPRLAAVSGFTAVALLVASFLVVAQPPQPGDEVRFIADYYVANAAAVRAFIYLQILGTTAFLLFGVALASHLRLILGPASMLPTITLAGAVAGGSLTFAGMATFSALASGGASDAGPAVIRLMFDLGNDVLSAGDLTVVLLVVPSSVAALRAGALPRWIGYLGLLVAAAWIVASSAVLVTSGPLAGANGPVGLGAVMGLMVWVISLSATLIRRGR